MSTVQEIMANYNNSLASLKRYCDNLVKNIQKSSFRLGIKNQKIQEVKKFYNKTLQILIKKRDDDLKLANSKKFTALLVGIDYKGTTYELNGCINDANHMSQYLISQNISKDKIYILTDNTPVKPTKINIINSFKKLLNDATSGEQLVFFYSGHGSQVDNVDKNKDTEPLDDVLLTIDANYIIDDELNQIIQENLKPNVKLFVLFDCCHSGTMLDLKYNYPIVKNLPPVIVDNGSTGDTKSQVFYISGCKDDQESMDAFINSKSQGAFTWAFLEAVKNNSIMSWSKLVTSIRDNIVKYQFKQVPQFSCGIPCDVNSLWCFSK